MKSRKKEKAPRGQKPERRRASLRTWWEALDENRRRIVLKLSASVLAVFAVFTLIAMLSYILNWRQDMSLLEGLTPSGDAVGNRGGNMGMKWGHFLVCGCFGLGAFALLGALCPLCWNLFFRDRKIPAGRIAALSLTGAFLLSYLFAYVASLGGGDGLLSCVFGGGLGGDAGAAAVAWTASLVGEIVTGFVLILLTVVWFLFASRRFSLWFASLGERRPRAVEDAAEASEEAPAAADVPVEEEAVSDPLAEEMDLYGDLPGDDAAGEEAAPVCEAAAGPAPAPASVPADAEKPADGVKIEVEEGEGYSVEVKKELPRINIRDEEVPRFRFPSLDLLEDYASGQNEVSSEERERNSNRIKSSLANYGIQVDKVTVLQGPTVTLYKVTLAPGVKISQVKRLEDDVAMSLGARGVRVVRLEDSVGIEVANDRPSIVPLKSMLNDDAFRNNTKMELPVAIGYTISRKVKVFDLAGAPHLLVAGATQQGKSVGLNVIIASLLYAKHPSELKFVFVDPKMVEFNAYGNLLKHYLAVLPTSASGEDEARNAIIKTPKQAEEVLRSLCKEMDDRYSLMSRTPANNIKLYNEYYKDRKLLPTEGHHFMPYLVVVIDEYSDLIMTGGSGPEAKKMSRSISESIIRLAQKGRAAGIHVILATQRPSVDVITGLIKTNFPTRIAFRTVTRVDSGTILDTPGAEKLIGKGDMLYYAGVDMERVQCALVSMEEIYRITSFIASQDGYKQCYSTPFYLPAPENAEQDAGGNGMVDTSNLDELFRSAAEMVVTSQMGSTSTLQRKLGMGYARAGRVMDQLEAVGIVGPQEGSKPRQVLVGDLSELNELLSHFDV